MMEVKIQCACGAKFKFDVEPVNGMMPAPVHCPTCNADATVSANVIISQNRQAALAAPAPPVGGTRLRVAGAAAPVEAAESPGFSANRRLLERTTFFIKERVALTRSKPGGFWQEYKFTNPVSKKIEPKAMYCEKLGDTAVCGGVYL